MGRGPEISVPVDQTTQVGNCRVDIRSDRSLARQRRRRPGNTAIHEAIHAVVAKRNGTEVVKATNIAGEGYLGLTQTVTPDAIAAIAPHAAGMSGAHHDRNIVRALGHDEGAVAGIALGVINSNKEEIDEVATTIEEKGTAHTPDINLAMQRGEERRRGRRRPFSLTIKHANGQEVQVTRQSEDNKTVTVPIDMIAGEEVTFKKNQLGLAA